MLLNISQCSLFVFLIKSSCIYFFILQLYSNTPADFDFKLGRSVAQLLGLVVFFDVNIFLIWLIPVNLCSLARGFRSLSEFAEHLALMVDIVFPVIHGRFGEDGGIQVCSVALRMCKIWLFIIIIIVCTNYIYSSCW